MLKVFVSYCLVIISWCWKYRNSLIFLCWLIWKIWRKLLYLLRRCNCDVKWSWSWQGRLFVIVDNNLFLVVEMFCLNNFFLQFLFVERLLGVLMLMKNIMEQILLFLKELQLRWLWMVLLFCLIIFIILVILLVFNIKMV